MTSTAHALIAGAIAKKIGDPTLAIALSFTSHFIIDSIPHWDVGTNWRGRSKNITGALAIAETLAGITIAYLVFAGSVPFFTLILCIVASILPDWLETPWYIFFAHPRKHAPGKNASVWETLSYRVYKLENRFHTKAQLPFGAITQVATVAFFLFILR